MSLRLSEKYQTIKLKNGMNIYRIYNMEIVTRMIESSQMKDFITHSHQEQKTDSNRCTYRVLEFADPLKQFSQSAAAINSQTSQILQRQDEMNHDGINLNLGISQKTALQKQKQRIQFPNLRGKQTSISNHYNDYAQQQLESSNQSEHSYVSINKKISKQNDLKHLQKQKIIAHQNQLQNSMNYNSPRHSTSRYYYPPPPPDLSNSQGNSTEIIISTPNRLQNSSILLKPCLKITSQQEKNQQLQYEKKLSHSSISQNRCNELLRETDYKSNIEKKEEDQDEISIDIDIEDNQDEMNIKKQQPTGSRKGINTNLMSTEQQSSKFINNNKNNTKIENYNQKTSQNSSNISKSIQNMQIWSIDKDLRVQNNNKQQLSGKEKQNSSATGQYQNSQFGIKLPMQGDVCERENIHEGENKVSNSSISSLTTATSQLINNQNSIAQKTNINVSNNNNNNIHNSELFKQLSMEYKMIPKNNTLKNIKKAFIRYLLKTSRKQLIKKCEQFNLEVGYILTTICQEIKYDHRHNKNIRFLLKSEQVSPLFKDFLENSEDYWFSNSSLLNPGPCRQMVALLIKISQSDSLVDVIQEYEK